MPRSDILIPAATPNSCNQKDAHLSSSAAPGRAEQNDENADQNQGSDRGCKQGEIAIRVTLAPVVFLLFCFLPFSIASRSFFCQKIPHISSAVPVSVFSSLITACSFFRTGICKILGKYSSHLHGRCEASSILFQLFQIFYLVILFPPLDDVVNGVTIGLPFALQVPAICVFPT